MVLGFKMYGAGFGGLQGFEVRFKDLGRIVDWNHTTDLEDFFG